MTTKTELLLALDALAQAEIKITGSNVEECFEALGPVLSTLKSLKYVDKLGSNTSSTDYSSDERFIHLGLECLLRLKDLLEAEPTEVERLLSVAQQRQVRTVLERVVNAGVWPNLLPGVGPPVQTVGDAMARRSDLEKYECLCLVTKGLIELYHNDTFHGIVLPQFLTPLMCGLCQLTMVPLKKSSETFPRLQTERLAYQGHLDDIVNKLYQPMVIKELMVIEGNKKSPKWLKQGVGRLLTRQLHRPNGVLATLNAVRDAANWAAPNTTAHLESVARVITASPALDVICPQILELLDSKEPEVIKVGVLCIRTLHSRDPATCSARLLQPITQPLLSPSPELEVMQSLQRLHKCFAVPASDLWCLPYSLLLPNIHTLFTLYCKLHQSVSCIRQTTEDLVWRVLSMCDEALLKNVYRCLLYRQRVDGIDIIDRQEFVFGDEGGVRVEKSEKEIEISLEDYGDSLMILFERRDTTGLMGNKLFVTLLEFASNEEKEYTVNSFERQLLTIKLLAVLSENSNVQKSLSKNPEPVVNFLKVMIERHLRHPETDVEMICLVLVVLNVIINDCIFSKAINWTLFSSLEEPLSQLKSKTTNVELQMLAEEAFEVILTRGVVKPKDSHVGSNLAKSLKQPAPMRGDLCSEALREARDPLLPVRGHALIQLAKLLAQGDKQAKAKKDQILCIFQENLKEEDSFLYLSAIEGLASAATDFPDTVILSLTEQFSRRSLHPETRLKVGEALVRVTKMLGDLAPVYKAELINAFLSGTRDDDFLVRASSLSNLGELCRVLGFRVGPIVAEVLVCVRCIAQSDPSVEVRRAAVMLVTLMLKGLHKDTLTVLQDVLLELYRTLKVIHSRDADDVTRLHTQLALEELNSGTLAFLFPTPQLTKQIFVLDPPP